MEHSIEFLTTNNWKELKVLPDTPLSRLLTRFKNSSTVEKVYSHALVQCAGNFPQEYYWLCLATNVYDEIIQHLHRHCMIMQNSNHNAVLLWIPVWKSGFINALRGTCPGGTFRLFTLGTFVEMGMNHELIVNWNNTLAYLQQPCH